MLSALSWFRALLVLLLIAAPVSLRAAQYTDSGALDELFAQLRVASTAAEADDLSNQIWGYWLNPSDPDLAKRMTAVAADMSNGDTSGALTALNDIVKTYPDYSEGWNQRATLYYTMGNLDASLADIEKVLAL